MHRPGTTLKDAWYGARQCLVFSQMQLSVNSKSGRLPCVRGVKTIIHPRMSCRSKSRRTMPTTKAVRKSRHGKVYDSNTTTASKESLEEAISQ